MPVYPSFRYRDPKAALAWLDHAFGFPARVAYEDDAGEIGHAEVEAGGGLVMLGSQKDDAFGDHAGQGWVYVAIEDPDALFARATGAGAEVVRPLQHTDYGSRDFSVRDLEGNIWSFGTYAPQAGEPD